MQALSLIDIWKIAQVNECLLEIKISDRIKTSGPKRKQLVVRLPVSNHDKSFCAVTALISYSERTKEIRGSILKLSISLKKTL